MKKNLLTAVCGMLLVAFASAQVPESLNYQAVARNAAGSPLINSSVAVRISIHDGSATGTVVYSERDAATTNGFGLFSCAIGTGNVISGTFAGINWANNTKFMQVELDPTGGSSYTDMGTTQLLSVPYALHARTAHVADSATNVPSVWTTSGNNIYNSNSGNVGIGTVDPQYKLHVVDSTDPGEVNGLNLENRAEGSSRLRLTTANNHYAYLNRNPSVSAGTINTIPTNNLLELYNDGGDMMIDVYQHNIYFAGNGFSNIMAITPNAVGIGTNTPGQNLHVYSSQTNVGIAIDGGTAGRARLGLLPGGVDNGELGFRNGLQIGSVSDASLVMTNEWIRVTSAGNVGIGTTSPAAKLDIAGNVKIADGTQGAGKLLVSDANGLASWQTVAVGTTSYTGLTHHRAYISGTLSPWVNITTSGADIFIISSSYTSAGLIEGFQHDGGDEFVIFNNCNYNWTIVPGIAQGSLGTNARAFYTGPSAANYVIAPGKSVRAFYEPTTDKWWVLDGN